MPLSSFTIRKKSGHILLNTQNSFNHCFFKQYSPDPLYKMAICAQSPNFPDQLEIIRFDELYSRFMAVYASLFPIFMDCLITVSRFRC